MNEKKLIICLLCIAILIGTFFYSIAKTNASIEISEESETTLIKDSDGDGIFDSNDPNPDISQIYIVKDNNKNGIVDSFEEL